MGMKPLRPIDIAVLTGCFGIASIEAAFLIPATAHQLSVAIRFEGSSEFLAAALSQTIYFAIAVPTMHTALTVLKAARRAGRKVTIARRMQLYLGVGAVGLFLGPSPEATFTALRALSDNLGYVAFRSLPLVGLAYALQFAQVSDATSR